MAVKLQKSLSITLGNIVTQSIQSARAQKAKVIAEKEAAFQAVVSDGMSYEAQLEFRKKQLEDEKASSIPDSDYVTTLTSSVAQIKKLNRFNKYRQKYQDSYSSLKAGRINAMEHLSFLKTQLGSATDPELQLEIKNSITAAEQDVKTYEDNILTNQVTRARNDGTVPLLNDAISKVNDRRAKALLSGNDEEVTAYDNTLTVLKTQLNQTLIEDKSNELEIKTLRNAMDGYDKVRELNNMVASADASAPVTIGGRRYASAQEYWAKTRDAYLAGAGSGIFVDFFNEVSSDLNDTINAAVNRDGYATTLTLDNIKNKFNELRTKSELAPYMEKINNLEANALGTAFRTTAKLILDRATYNQDFKAADVVLKQYSQRYGVDAEQYRLALAEEINRQALEAAGGDVNKAKQIVQKSGAAGITTPQQEFKIEALPKRDVSADYGLVGQTVYDKKTNTAIGSEDELARRLGVAKVDFGNTTFDTNYVPPAPTPAPTAVAPTTQTPAQNPAQQVPAPTTTPAPTTAPTTQPAPAPTPATPTPTPTKYTGNSIVDYLKTTGQDTSFTNRKKLAEQYGITGYVGSAEQNTKLLGILNK